MHCIVFLYFHLLKMIRNIQSQSYNGWYKLCFKNIFSVQAKRVHVALIKCASREWIYQTFTDNNNTTTTAGATTGTTTTKREHGRVRLKAKNNGAEPRESRCNSVKEITLKNTLFKGMPFVRYSQTTMATMQKISLI